MADPYSPDVLEPESVSSASQSMLRRESGEGESEVVVEREGGREGGGGGGGGGGEPGVRPPTPRCPPSVASARRQWPVPVAAICCQSPPFVASRRHLLPVVAICCQSPLLQMGCFSLGAGFGCRRI